MSGNRRRIVVAEPKRFLSFLAIVVLIAAVPVLFFVKPWGDSVVKQIEKERGEKIKTVIKTYIAVYDNEGNDISDNAVYNTLNEEDVIKFRVIYNYQTESGSINNYPVADGIKITVSDTAYATVADDKSIVIPNGLSKDYELTVTVKYKKLSMEYKYTIKAGSALPQTDTPDNQNTQQ